MFATVVCDASYCPESGRAAWAAWIRLEGISQPIKIYGVLKGSLDNSTQAEILSALNGCFVAKMNGARYIHIVTDCMSIVSILDGKAKSRKLLSFWHQALGDSCLIGANISAKHVKGHTRKKDSRSWANRWCDRKAKQMLRGGK